MQTGRPGEAGENAWPHAEKAPVGSHGGGGSTSHRLLCSLTQNLDHAQFCYPTQDPLPLSTSTIRSLPWGLLKLLPDPPTSASTSCPNYTWCLKTNPSLYPCLPRAGQVLPPSPHYCATQTSRVSGHIVSFFLHPQVAGCCGQVLRARCPRKTGPRSPVCQLTAFISQSH